MNLLRTFLKPGWLLTTVLVAAFAAACFLILAPWQLGKNTATEHRNDRLRAATATGAVPLDALAPPGAAFNADDEWREVTLTGTYLPQDQVLLRFQYADERPAVGILTPLRLAGSERTVLVNRGWIRPGPDGTVTLPATPVEQVTVHGRLRASEGTSPGKEPRPEATLTGGGEQLSAYTIDTAALGAATGVGLESFYVQLIPEQPGGLGVIDLPQLESGPYLSYGLQWLAFGIMAPLGVGYFVWAEVRHRRILRAAAEGGAAVETEPAADSRAAERRRIRDELRAAGTAGDEPRSRAEVGVGAPPPETPDDDVAAKLARRYGR